MADVNVGMELGFSQMSPSGSDKEKIDYLLASFTRLEDAYVRMKRDLENALQTIDSSNVTEIDADRVNVTNLTAGTIKTGELVVGGAVGQGTARRNFTAQPTTPYSLGDTWTQGSTGDFKVCTTARATGAYTAGDWTLSTKYTDDSTANVAISNAATANSNLTTLISNIGDLAYLDLVSSAKLDSTIILGGYIKTSLIESGTIIAGSVAAQWVYAGTLTANQVNAVSVVAEKLKMAGSPNNYGSIGGYYGDLILYYSNSEFFRVYNEPYVSTIKTYGHSILAGSSVDAQPMGTWDFSYCTPTNFPLPSHAHDDRYYTEAEQDSRFVEAGTGGSKTISHINATSTGLIVWFTDATNATILYT